MNSSSYIQQHKTIISDNYFAIIYNFHIFYLGYDGKSLKAYKSLQGYRYFEAGWVHQVVIAAADRGQYVLKGKVSGQFF